MTQPAESRRRSEHPVRAALLGALLVEIIVTVAAIRLIGFWPTVGLLLALSVLGGWLVRRGGGRAPGAVAAGSRSGRMPTGELGDAALILVGGALLLVPGFVTGLVGLCFLLPLTRPLTRLLLARLLAKHLLGSVRLFTVRGLGGSPDVVQGQVVPDERGPADVRPPQFGPQDSPPQDSPPQDGGDDEAGRTR